MYVGSCGDSNKDCCQTSPRCSPLPQQEDLPRALPSAKTVHLWTDTTQGNEQGENDKTTALLNSRLGLDEKKRRRRPPRCWLHASKMAATISGCSTADDRKNNQACEKERLLLCKWRYDGHDASSRSVKTKFLSTTAAAMVRKGEDAL